MKNPSNWFTVDVSVHFPKDEQEHNLNHWLNIQHTGKPTMPFTQKISEKHTDAAWNMHRGRMVRMTFEINEKGNWKLHGAHFI
jgi:hypothetical protein